MHDLDQNYLWYAHYQRSTSQFYPYHTPITSTEFIKSQQWMGADSCRTIK